MLDLIFEVNIQKRKVLFKESLCMMNPDTIKQGEAEKQK